jgi:hypothetical protein
LTLSSVDQPNVLLGIISDDDEWILSNVWSSELHVAIVFSEDGNLIGFYVFIS